MAELEDLLDLLQEVLNREIREATGRPSAWRSISSCWQVLKTITPSKMASLESQYRTIISYRSTAQGDQTAVTDAIREILEEYDVDVQPV